MKDIFLLTNPVKVGVRILWHVIVKHNVNSFYIHSTTKQIGGYQHSLGEIFKLFVARQSANDNKVFHKKNL